MSQPVKPATRPLQTAKERSRLRAKARRRRRRITFIFLVSLFIFIVGIIFKLVIPKETLAELFKGTSLKTQNILLLGVDYDYDPEGHKVSPDNQRTDTILLAHFDPQNHILNVMSLPRDTRVLLPGHGINKLNSAHALGGPELLESTIEALLGINIDRYIRIDLRRAEGLLAMMGPLDIYVENPMHYVDNTAKLKIDLEPGWHQLRGRDAVAFARFRHDELGDIGRVHRQQALINAIQQKLTHPLNWWRIPRLVTAGYDSVKTDMPLSEMSAIAQFIKERDRMSTRFVTLPGDFGQSGYWLPNLSRVESLRNLLFTPQSLDPQKAAPETCTVALRYDPKLADRIEGLTRRINDSGLQVITSQPLEAEEVVTSRVIAYDRFPQWEEKLRGAVSGLPWQLSDEGSDYSADYTVILGADYR